MRQTNQPAYTSVATWQRADEAYGQQLEEEERAERRAAHSPGPAYAGPLPGWWITDDMREQLASHLEELRAELASAAAHQRQHDRVMLSQMTFLARDTRPGAKATLRNIERAIAREKRTRAARSASSQQRRKPAA